MNKLTSLLAGASMLVIAGGVSAEPMALSADQMDGVSAGALVVFEGAGYADSGAGAISNLLGITYTNAEVDVQPGSGFVVSSAEGFSIAESSHALGVPTNGAVAFSGSSSSATLF
jgi:hypothetical protein